MRTSKFFRMIRFFLFLWAVAALPVFAEAVYQAHTQVEIVTDQAAIEPGAKFHAGILFRMDPEWHIYWKNPGDSGMTPVIEWKLPEGMTAGEIEWPVPEKIDLPPLSSYGYEKEVLLAAPFKVADSFSANQPVVIRAKVEWLACKVECIPGKAELELRMPFKNQSGLFEKTRAQYPLKNPPGPIRAFQTEKNLKIIFSGTTARAELYFFPENPELIQHAEPQALSGSGRGYELSIPLAVTHPKNLTRLRGILVSVFQRHGWEIDIPLELPAAAAPFSLMSAVLFAFLGGLILNLMPCVLPVLSLKILSFVNEAEKKSTGKQGLIFTAGVLISFWILAAALMILKSGGQQIGWGFQLQSPGFVGFLALVFFILALNLFGLFEIGLPWTGAGQNLTQKKGWAGTFMSGVLAVIVATPCTAPFMGAALGYALTQPAWTAWAVFTALGLGLAFPYLILCVFPGWLRFLPKPGPWMLKLKKFFGILLLLTAFWLVWILSVQLNLTKSFESGKNSNHLEWETYSENRLAALLAEGKPVFVDFTAAWCLTCQVNERLALNRKETADFFREKKIIALKADWTNRDETITRSLAAFGRNSIPFYVFYPGPGREPVILPEILTPQIVHEALDWQKQQN